MLFIEDLKAKSEQAINDTIIVTRIIDEEANKQQSSGYLHTYAAFPLE